MAALVDSGFPKASSGQASKTFLGCQNESPMEQVIEPEDNVDYSSISSPVSVSYHIVRNSSVHYMMATVLHLMNSYSKPL